MLNNLFSSFDSKNYFISLYFLMIYYFFYMYNSTMTLSQLTNINSGFNVFFFSLINKSFFNICIFLLILFSNLLSLNLFNFSVTSQLMFNLPLILMLWLPLLLINLLKKKNIFLIHLVPFGTPSMLTPMMVIIELISFIIRPLTLLLRLSINMIAGHVLVTLLSNSMLNNNLMFSFLIYIYMMLKLMVSFIQAYIVITLISMYIEEV